METQRILFENSKDIPEGLYIELMNKLKIDFDKAKTEKSVLVINKSVAKHILYSKKELIEKVITCSVDWEDREDALIKINRMSYWKLKEYCISRGLGIMKVNPRWIEQERLIRLSGFDRELLRSRFFSPGIVNISI
jgi:hypothetical protein